MRTVLSWEPPPHFEQHAFFSGAGLYSVARPFARACTALMASFKWIEYSLLKSVCKNPILAQRFRRKIWA
jgi:hypothetical protein